MAMKLCILSFMHDKANLKLLSTFHVSVYLIVIYYEHALN